MPVTPTYPGVYIEEIPSGVRTITGVATSITAFIGRTARGPVNQPVQVNSFADFERVFGGLSLTSPLSYAVRDFYLNGGSQALIVRIFRPFFGTDADRAAALDAAQDVAAAAADAADEAGADGASVATAARNAANAAENANPPRNAAADAVADAAEAARDAGADANGVRDAAANAVGSAAPLTRAQLTVGGLNLEAANEGTWGNSLRARIDYNTRDPTDTNLFNLSIRDMATGQTEVIRNVSVQTNATRRLDNVLRQESSLARAFGALPGARPAASPPPASGSIPAGVVPAGEDPFSNTNSTGVALVGNAADSQSLNDTAYTGDRTNKRGLYALEKADLFNLLCIPPDTMDGDTTSAVYGSAMSYCVERRAMLIVDPPTGWDANPDTAAATALAGLGGLSLSGTGARNAAIYFPRVLQSDPLRDGQIDSYVPCGIIAGVMARTDTTRGVWKAPAGLDAAMNGIQGLTVNLNDAENGMLNPVGINCLRSFPINGRVVWGARTLRGADQLADEYKYVPVRRLALFLEESLYRGTQWVVFEPNDEPLWAQIRLNIGAFLQNLFRQGAFQGKTPREAYFVKCDSETTTQNDINLGIVNIIVGFAPLKPAEFVIIKLQQMAGQIEV